VPAAKNTHTTQITDFSYLYLFRYNVVNGLQWAQKQEKKLFLSFLYRDCSVPKKNKMSYQLCSTEEFKAHGMMETNKYRDNIITFQKKS
jgi:hypothetical protein